MLKLILVCTCNILYFYTSWHARISTPVHRLDTDHMLVIANMSMWLNTRSSTKLTASSAFRENMHQKKKKRFLNATWHSSSIHGCSAEVHWSHCVTHWLSMQIKLSKSDTQCVCDRERKTECSVKVSARKNERESRANADRSFAVKPEKSDLIWSKLKE